MPPQVARCEEYDSDEGSVRPGTRTEARRPTVPPSSMTRHNQRDERRRQHHAHHRQPDAASDSGYFSHTTDTQGSGGGVGVGGGGGGMASSADARAMMPPPPVPLPRPFVHRAQSDNSRPRRQEEGGKKTCASVNCQDLTCSAAVAAAAAAGNASRRNTISQPTPPSPSRYAAVQPPGGFPLVAPYPNLSRHPQQPQYPSSSRPSSFHAHSQPIVPSLRFSAQASQPPSFHPAYQQQRRIDAPLQAYYQPYGYPSYPPDSPTKPAGITTGTSAPPSPVRHPILNPRTFCPPVAAAAARPPRLPSARIQMPGAFPHFDSSEESSFASDSESDHDHDHARRRSYAPTHHRNASSSSHRRPANRDRSATAPVPFAPDVSHARAPSREDRARRLSSSHHGDPRTASHHPATLPSHQEVPRARPLPTDSTGTRSSNSRRPSLSTTASSGGRTSRTTATTPSSVYDATSTTQSPVIVVEDPRRRRRTSYLSQRDRDSLADPPHQPKSSSRKLRDAEAYQGAMAARGPGAYVPTAVPEPVQPPSKSHSHSQSRSRSRSRSSTTPSNRAITIDTGGTVLRVCGDATHISMSMGKRASVSRRDDGGASQLKFGDADGRSSRSGSGRGSNR